MTSEMAEQAKGTKDYGLQKLNATEKGTYGIFVMMNQNDSQQKNQEQAKSSSSQIHRFFFTKSSEKAYTKSKDWSQ